MSNNFVVAARFLPFLLLFSYLTACTSSKQSANSEALSDGEPYIQVDVLPQLIGGSKSIAEAIRYPPEAKRKRIAGRVYTQFTILPDGSVTDVNVVQSPHRLLSMEARHTAKRLKFTPAMKDGKKVAVKFSLPINFRLGR